MENTKKSDNLEKNKNHRLELDNHKLLAVSGVKNVPTFTDKGLVVELSGETLTVSGRDLSVKKLDVDKEELLISGYVTALKYGDSRESGLLKKLLK